MSVETAGAEHAGEAPRSLRAEGVAWLLAALLVAVPALLAGRPGWAAAALPASLALLTAWIAWEDARHLLIPDAATAGLACLALVDLLSTALFQLDPAGAGSLFVLEAMVCGGALWLLREIHFRRRGQDGIGFGDVKLAAAGGALCGLGGFSTALLIASLGGLAVAFVAGRRLRADMAGAKIAFGALLAPALWIVWFAEARW